MEGNKYSNVENATHGHGFRCNSDLIQHVMQSSRRIGHLFVEAREHMNSEFGISECMRRMPASLCLNLQCLSSECLKPGVGIWPNVLNLGFTNTTAVRMMFHTNTTRVREVSPRGCPNGFFFCKVGTSKMFTMFKSMPHHKHKLL